MEKASTKTYPLKQKDNWRYHGTNFHITCINPLIIPFASYLANEFYLSQKLDQSIFDPELSDDNKISWIIG